GVSFRFLRLIFRKDWNESGRHRPFRKQLTKQVGDTIGHEESVRRRRCPKKIRPHHVADEPKDSAGKGSRADHTGRFDHRASTLLRIRWSWGHYRRIGHVLGF